MSLFSKSLCSSGETWAVENKSINKISVILTIIGIKQSQVVDMDGDIRFTEEAIVKEMKC